MAIDGNILAVSAATILFILFVWWVAFMLYHSKMAEENIGFQKMILRLAFYFTGITVLVFFLSMLGLSKSALKKGAMIAPFVIF